MSVLEEIDSLYDEDESTPPGVAPTPESGSTEAPDGTGDGKDPEKEAAPVVESTEDKENADTEDGDDDRTSVSRFLDGYGIKGGQISFEDGTEANIDEMTAEQQLEVLQTIVNTTRPTVEQEFALDDDEISALNYMRQQKVSFPDLVSKMADKKILEMQASEQFTGDINFEEMPVDVLFERYLREQSPDASEDEIAEDLEAAKGLRNYEKTVDAIRKNYVVDRDTAKNEWYQKREQLKQAEFQSDATAIVESARTMEELAGWPIDEDMKNTVLQDLVEVDENMDSKFMRDVVGNPAKLFEAAWYMKYAPTLFERMDTYFKKEVDEAYKKGKKDGSNHKVGGLRKPDTNKAGTPASTSKPGRNASSLNDLYD